MIDLDARSHGRLLGRFARGLLGAALLATVACGAPESALEPVSVVEEISPVGNPGSPIPAGGDGWSSVTVGINHSCALTTAGVAYCWGDARTAQIGIAEAPDVCGPPAAPCARRPVRVTTSVRFTQLSAGGTHTCGLDAQGNAFCWGNNEYGQLGLASPRVVYEPVSVQGGHRFRDISAGEHHTCGVRVDGAVLCWGRNENGELGRGNFSASAVPTVVAGLSGVQDVSAGSSRTCAVTADGSYCWGRIWLYTQGGLEWSSRQVLPVRVPGSAKLRAVSVGSISTCGVGEDGVAFCWEANGFGQLGNGGFAGTTTPSPVESAQTFTSVSAGSIQTCGLASDGRGWCWGNNSFGQLGDYSIDSVCPPNGLVCTPRPNPVVGDLRFISLATGLGNHVCGVTTLTNLYCWGLGASGQLGDDDARTVVRLAPEPVAARMIDAADHRVAARAVE